METMGLWLQMVMLKRCAPKNDSENRWNFVKWTNGDPKTTRKLGWIWVDFGSPFVHLTKFHRFSASFFGAHLFSFAIWVHIRTVSSKMTKTFPTYTVHPDFPNVVFPKMKYGLFWVAMAPFGLETGSNEPKLVQNPYGPLLDHFWTSFGPVWTSFVRAWWAPGPLV